ncbi:MFS transporter [Nitrospinae bacterium AH_259_B05_G02_I21]|nr:MFS transporter [Nitrospinae bacterium AH_259_B05_G02_I21]
MTVQPNQTKLGLKENWQQFTLLLLTVGFVGSMVGLERTVVPLIGEQEFGLASKTAIVSFIITFGVVKSLCNFLAGRISETWGRKKVLVLGWVIGLPVPLIIIYANSWFWIDVANVLLGINQALTWSMTVNMKIDLVGPKRRGLAVGLNEFAGYFSVGIMAWLTGEIAARYGLRPEPFYLGVVIAVAGLLVSLFFVRDTIEHVRYEARLRAAEAASQSEPGNPESQAKEKPSLKEIFSLTTWKDRSLSSCSQAGLVNNLNDGMSWGIYPLFFSSYGLGVAAIGVIKAVYPAFWGLLQPITGPLSDRIGRKRLIVGGMLVQSVGIWMTAMLPTYSWWIVAAVIQGVGTAMVYPVIIAAVGDVAQPEWRATSLGVYRFWRDLGYAVGALLAGLIADFVGMKAAIHTIAALTLTSGLVVAFRMYETLPSKRGT